MAGLFHPLLCSFCGFTALFPKGTVLLQLLFACLFQGVTLFCVFPVVDRQCLVLARQCRKKKVPLLAVIASHFEDLADPIQFEPWRLIAIDTSRGRSRNRELHHPCYILVDFCAFRSFGLRPHGVIEVVLGQEEFSFPTVLPMLPCSLVAHRTSGSAMASLAQWRPIGCGFGSFRCKCGADQP